MSFSSSFRFLIPLTKCDESLMNEKVQPTNGLRFFGRNSSNWYIADPMVFTIGLKGIPSLFILGTPYILGMIRFFGVSFLFYSSISLELSIIFLTYLIILALGSQSEMLFHFGKVIASIHDYRCVSLICLHYHYVYSLFLDFSESWFHFY